MYRRLFALALAAGVLAAPTGCRTSCGDRPGLCTSRARSEATGQTVGQGCGCFDAVTGQPVPCPPEAPGTLLPGGSPYPIPGGLPPGAQPPRFDELPMPGPADRIPNTAVPVPAPAGASLPYPVSPGVPVKVTPNR